MPVILTRSPDSNTGDYVVWITRYGSSIFLDSSINARNTKCNLVGRTGLLEEQYFPITIIAAETED